MGLIISRGLQYINIVMYKQIRPISVHLKFGLIRGSAFGEIGPIISRGLQYMNYCHVQTNKTYLSAFEIGPDMRIGIWWEGPHKSGTTVHCTWIIVMYKQIRGMDKIIACLIMDSIFYMYYTLPANWWEYSLELFILRFEF